MRIGQLACLHVKLHALCDSSAARAAQTKRACSQATLRTAVPKPNCMSASRNLRRPPAHAAGVPAALASDAAFRITSFADLSLGQNFRSCTLLGHPGISLLCKASRSRPKAHEQAAIECCLYVSRSADDQICDCRGRRDRGGSGTHMFGCWGMSQVAAAATMKLSKPSSSRDSKQMH